MEKGSPLNFFSSELIERKWKCRDKFETFVLEAKRMILLSHYFDFLESLYPCLFTFNGIKCYALKDSTEGGWFLTPHKDFLWHKLGYVAFNLNDFVTLGCLGLIANCGYILVSTSGRMIHDFMFGKLADQSYYYFHICQMVDTMWEGIVCSQLG